LCGFFMLRVGGMLFGCFEVVRGHRGRNSIHSGLPSSGRGAAGGCTRPSWYLQSGGSVQGGGGMDKASVCSAHSHSMTCQLWCKKKDDSTCSVSITSEATRAATLFTQGCRPLEGSRQGVAPDPAGTYSRVDTRRSSQTAWLPESV
jgi:hypothetical protein